MQEKFKDRNILRCFLAYEYKEFKFFSTFTFADQVRFKDEQTKLQLFKNFIQNLRKKTAFEYFWVSEKDGEDQMHFHVLATWEFSYDYIQKKWNDYLSTPDRPSVRTDFVVFGEDSHINRVNYCFKEKEKIKNYGLSLKIREQYIIFWKFISYSDFTALVEGKQSKSIIKLYQNKIGTEVDEQKYEQSIVDIYNERELDPGIIDWIQKLTMVLYKEKNIFIEIIIISVLIYMI